jgi:phage terminase large subunit
MELIINTTKTFENLLHSTKRVSQHIGGTRSGKSYAILQYLIFESIQKPLNITVVRKTVPLLKRTIIKDFKEILQFMQLWRETDFNVTDRLWEYPNGSTIQFISTDDPDKLRGIKSDILFIDEASEIDEESYFQLSIRTTNRIILAYNPTVSPFHWLRQMVDCDRYVTTYKDNPYIPKEMIKAIEELEHTNPKYYKIYGKGEFAPNEKAVYQFQIIDEYEGEFVGFGLDFGFSQDPTAMVGVWRNGNNLYVEEFLYEKGMVASDIINYFNSIGVKREEIWCDSADPRLIEELYRAGFNTKAVKKGSDSIRFGISTLKNYKLHVHRKSQNLINELYAYQYSTDKYGYVTDIPEGGMDHLLDGLRYLALMRLTLKSSSKGTYNISIR